MLAAAHRIRRSADFAATIRGGRRAARGALVVHLQVPARFRSDPRTDPRTDPEPAHAAENAPPPRAGFVVSKAVGGAVTRNRVERRLRHLVRDRLALLPPGAMLVVRALPAAAGRGHSELGADLDGALARATSGRKR